MVKSKKSHPKKDYLNGLTLIEVIISTLIIALIMAGLVNLFIAAKRYSRHARSRMQATELGRLFIEPLQMHVTQEERSLGAQDGWDEPSNALRLTGAAFRYCDSDPAHVQQPLPFCPSQAERTLDGIEYSARYEINPHPQNNNIRRVVTTISWNEPPP